MLQRLNRAGTLLLALTVVVTPPTAALLWAIHTSWRPSRTQLYAWLQDPPAGAAVVVLIATLATALWALVTTLILRTITQHLMRAWRRLTRLPLPTPAQATAGSLAGTALLGLPATVTATAPEPPPASGSTHNHTDRSSQQDDTRSDDPQVGHDAGIDLSDHSWIPAGTVQQVAAMTSLFWLRRRQTYRPGNPPAPPAPPAASAITAHAETTYTLGPVPVDQLPTGHTTLTGAGAHAAARGLLVTALMTPTPTPVIITVDDWHTLLGDTPTRLAIPGLHVTDDIATVLHHIHHTGDPPTAQPTILHLTRGPARPTHRAIDAARLITISFDSEPAGPRAWHVDADGHLTAHGTPQRLCVLGRQTAHDLLTLIALTHQPPQDVVAAAPPPTPPQPSAPATNEQLTSSATTNLARPAHLTVLGDLRLAIDGTPVPIRRSAAWQILVLLATRPDGATSHDLVAAIWPGLPPASISRRLYTTLSDLRASLRPSLGGGDVIHRRADRYALDPAVIDVDLWHLHTAAHAAATTITIDTQHRTQQAVIAAYTGELAAGHPWHWLAEPRDTIRRAVIDSYVDLAASMPPNRAIALLTDAVHVDPYNRHLHRLTTDALAAIGNHTAVTRLQHEYTRWLAEAGLPSSDD